jgi:predicted CXXCH cytochrome family protein
MKHQSKLLLTLLHGVGIGAVAMTGNSLISTDAVAGISNTKHNLTNSDNANKMTGGATLEICVFCHTPHGADTTTDGAPPLWNKKLKSTGYTTYAQLGSSSLDANNNNGSLGTGSISLACLSCHDGTQAMDNIINAPGSGKYDSSGGNDNGLTGAEWGWSTTSSRVDGEGKLVATTVTNLSQDLRNDHPIGIQYCGGFSGEPVNNTTTNCRDGDFNKIMLNGGSGKTSQWYIESNDSNGSRDKSDMMLYTRDFGTNVWRPSVECGSCHDPHVETKASTETAFLRITQNASKLCLTCHNK